MPYTMMPGSRCQELLKDPEFEALGGMGKEGIIRKTEAFEKFFDRCFRKRGQPMRERRQAWRDLKNLDENSSMSEDLQAFFLLKGCNLRLRRSPSQPVVEQKFMHTSCHRTSVAHFLS